MAKKSKKHPMRSPDYIGSDYYGFNYPSLVIAHTRGMTSVNTKTTYLPGNLVIVAAMGEDRNIYGFLGTAIEVIEGLTSADVWPGCDTSAPVNRIKVLTPIKLIPDTTYSQMTQGGLKKVDRPVVAKYLRDESKIYTPLPEVESTPAPVPAWEPEKVDKPGKIGYVYVIQNLLGEGFKIGITDNIHRRFKQLDVGTKAACIGYWSSENYKNLEKFLHTQFNPQNVPQSEWFILSDKQLTWTIEWLNDNASQVELNIIEQPEETEPVSKRVRLWTRIKQVFA